MADIPDISKVMAYGKIIFARKRPSVPPLPPMSLLILNEEQRGEIYPYRAVCLDLEIDACGNTAEEAWKNLKQALLLFIDMHKKAAGGSIIETAKAITTEVFSDSTQKRGYFNLYREAKRCYTMENIESGKLPDEIEEQKQRLEKLESNDDDIISLVTELKAA